MVVNNYFRETYACGEQVQAPYIEPYMKQELGHRGVREGERPESNALALLIAQTFIQFPAAAT